MYYKTAQDLDSEIIDIIVEDELEHSGVKRRSGRYPWGSGDVPYQHEEGFPFNTSGDFLSRVEELEKQGLTAAKVAEALSEQTGEKITSKELHVFKAIAKAERKAETISQIKSLHDQGFNNSEIGRQLGMNESSVRAALKEADDAKTRAVQPVIDFLKQRVDEVGYVDVGGGAEKYVGPKGIPPSRFEAALIELKAEGYFLEPRRIDYATNPNSDNKLTVRVLAKPGTEYKDIYDHLDEIEGVIDFAIDDDGTVRKVQYPASLDSKRLQVVYGDKGGLAKDGLIEIRRGLTDLNLGDGVHYAQGRILVDGTHYLKGMMRYADDLPDGIDVRFNTNKNEDVPVMGTGKDSILKPIKKDPKNPFGAYIPVEGQYEYDGEDGKKHLSPINKTRGEGEWKDWSNDTPSQFLAKQKEELISKQLNLSLADKDAELESIMQITNPTLRKHFLEDFADDCDATAVSLSAASLPGQQYHVLLPLDSIKDNEVFAPNYEDGTTVALVRFPHGGTFEIPVLTVNNKNKEGRSTIGADSIDAVGISSAVAAQLSGADFDGDTALVIPTTKGRNGITTSPLPKGLKDFDPKTAYPYIEGIKVINKEDQQKKMGEVSNLIMDMTLKGADPEDIAKATRHSMVIIDAEKHKLNWKQSYIDNDIAALEKEYKEHVDENGNLSRGASTLITRAGSEKLVPKRQGQAYINEKGKPWYDSSKEEGAIVYKVADDDKRFYTDAKGNVQERMSKSTQMAETSDAHTLSSGTSKEYVYAEYANGLKARANAARRTIISTEDTKYDKNAALKYSNEVASLNAKLNNAEKNRARERIANLKANSEINARLEVIKEEDPGISKTDYKKQKKKIAQSAIEKYRTQYGAKRDRINITDSEWEAIQAGAIPKTKFKSILNYADPDQLRQRATPKQTVEATPAQQNRIKAMAASGYTNAQIAAAVGLSTTTVTKYKK